MKEKITRHCDGFNEALFLNDDNSTKIHCSRQQSEGEVGPGSRLATELHQTDY
jgi:hypothetical protein